MLFFTALNHAIRAQKVLTSKVYVCIIVFLGLNTSGCMANNDSDLLLSMSVDQSELINGEVVLVSELFNNKQQRVSVLPWNTPLDSSVNGHFLRIVKQSSSQETELSYQGRMVKRMAPSPESYVHLDAGKSYENRLNLTNSYNFCRDSEYTIHFVGSFYAPEAVLMPVVVDPIKFRTSQAFGVCH